MSHRNAAAAQDWSAVTRAVRHELSYARVPPTVDIRLDRWGITDHDGVARAIANVQDTGREVEEEDTVAAEQIGTVDTEITRERDRRHSDGAGAAVFVLGRYRIDLSLSRVGGAGVERKNQTQADVRRIVPELHLDSESLFGLFPKIVALHKRQEIAAPAEIRIGWTRRIIDLAIFGIIDLRRWKDVVGVVIVVEGQADLLEIILAACPTGAFRGLR